MEPTATTAPALPRPIEEIRAEFPILAREIHDQPLAYLDNGATAQKPLAVIDALDGYWREHNANVHRGVHTLSEEATALYEGARASVASHLGADRREVIFVRNATEALNLVAYSWGRSNLEAGDRIVVTEMEHHSNVVPWYQVTQEKGAHLDWAPVDDDGRLDLDAFAALLERGPKLVAVAHVSNVLGTINPIEEIARLAHDAGALLVVDGAQSGPKLELDMAGLGADFYAITAHKMYGPTGIGALFGRRELLEEMPPFIGGGSMIQKVTKELITWASLPAKFEGGTPPIGEAVGFGAAVRWIDELGLPAIHAAETELTAYALERVAEVPGLRVFGPPAGDQRGGIVSFDMDGVHAHDIAEILDRHGVAVRAGHHCAQVLMQRLGVPATTRASFAVYNTRAEVDRLIDRSSTSEGSSSSMASRPRQNRETGRQAVAGSDRRRLRPQRPSQQAIERTRGPKQVRARRVRRMQSRGDASAEPPARCDGQQHEVEMRGEDRLPARPPDELDQPPTGIAPAVPRRLVVRREEPRVGGHGQKQNAAGLGHPAHLRQRGLVVGDVLEHVQAGE